ncbi:MAG: hypothetical protein K8S98_02755 [Planctomycetes bacterium]|nr:hypothetical protein [Planctomycetota bacterium]
MSAFFARAPDEVRVSVSRWLSVGRRARRIDQDLDRWIDDELTREERATPRRAKAVTRGRNVDLAELQAEVVSSCFSSEFAESPPPTITFGRAGAARARRSLRLGSYDPRAHLIRIHPVLDQDFVPRWFVRYIVFHELLHAAIPIERGRDGRRVFHGPRFRARERAFSDYARAIEWERAHLTELLRRPRRNASRPTLAGAWRAVQGWLFPV